MSKRQEMREKRKQQERNQRIFLIVGVAVVVLAVAAFFILPALNLKPVGEITQAPARTRTQVKFNAAGDPNAPVKIIEYADFQCPYCKQFTDNTEQQIFDNYVATGKVYFEYHSFGSFISAESARAAEAAYCAGDQGKFWEMHDMLFTNQLSEGSPDFNDRWLVAVAQKTGLDMATFNDCFTNGKYASQVLKDASDAQSIGIQATPSFTINGKLIQGAQPYDTFKTEIDNALAAAGAK